MSEAPREFSELWKDISDHPDRVILRLAILRDLSLRLHAERSLHLAQARPMPRPPLTENLEALEETLTAARGDFAKLDSLSLDEVLAAPRSRPNPVVLPPPLTAIIPRAKLERYDRQWEAALASVAFQRGWSFWELDATIQIPLAEAFHKHLSEILWPKALILFVESGDQRPITQGTVESNSGWRGRWLVVALPALDPVFLEIESSPGICPPSEAPAPDWRRLFPERAR